MGKNVKEGVGEVSSWQGSWVALKEENVGRDSAGIVASLSGGAGRSAQWVCWGGVVREHGSLNPQKQGSSSLPVADPPLTCLNCSILPGRDMEGLPCTP